MRRGRGAPRFDLLGGGALHREPRPFRQLAELSFELSREEADPAFRQTLGAAGSQALVDSDVLNRIQKHVLLDVNVYRHLVQLHFELSARPRALKMLATTCETIAAVRASLLVSSLK